MALATLSIDLVAKLQSLEAGFAKAQQLAEKNAKQIEGAFGKASAAVAGLGTSLVAGLAGFSFISFIHDVNEGVASLVDLRTATGASIENISALEDIARRSGATFDSVSTVLVKFNKALNTTNSAEFNEVREILKQIGLDAEELKRIDPAEALRRTAVAFSQYADDGTKARQSQVLFGKSLLEMVKFFDDLSKQQKLNATVTTEQAVAAKKFSDELAGVGKGATDAARALTGPLISALNSLIEKWRTASAESRDFWAEIRRQDEEKDRAVKEQGRADAIAAITKLLESGNLTLERRIRLQTQLNQLEAGERTPAPKVAPKGGDRIVDDRPALKEIKHPGKAPEAERVSAIDKLIDKLKEQVEVEARGTDAFAELHRVQRALANDTDLREATIEERVLILALAETVDKLKLNYDAARDAAVQHDELLGQGLAELTKQSNAQADALERLVAAGENEQLKQQRKDMELLAKAFESGAIDIVKFTDAVHARLGIIPRDFVAEWKSAVEEVQGSFESVLGGNLLSLFQGTTKGILDSWANLLQQMVAKALAAKIGEALFKGVDASSLFGQIISALTGFTGGSSINTTQANAGGGMVQPWSTSTVNEQGVEALRRQGNDVLLVGSKAGRVVPNNMLGQSVGTSVTFNIASGVSRNELAAMVPALTKHIESSLKMTMRRPGFR